MNIVFQLVSIYLGQETWNKTFLPLPEAIRYYQHMLNKGNLIYQTDDKGNVIGYIEWYFINYDQFRKLAENKGFPVLEENISERVDGNIMWISDVWIHPEHRHNSVYKNLKARLFNAAKSVKSCEYFAGREQGHNKRISIRRNFHGSD